MNAHLIKVVLSISKVHQMLLQAHLKLTNVYSSTATHLHRQVQVVLWLSAFPLLLFQILFFMIALVNILPIKKVVESGLIADMQQTTENSYSVSSLRTQQTPAKMSVCGDFR